MPYKDPVTQAGQQRLKWRVWREIQDGFCVRDTCVHCGLDIYGLDPERHSEDVDYYYHFVDPVSLGIRPHGKNDPVYDLVRTCRKALEHRWLPEAYETHAGEYQGFDPRAGAYEDMKELLRPKIDTLTVRHVATPRS